MRDVTITAREFKLFLWFALSRSPIGDVGNLDTIVEILKKLKGISHELAQTEEERENFVLPARELDEKEVVLSLEEAEWNLLQFRVKEWSKNVAVGVADEYLVLINKIKDAVKRKDELECA